MIQLMSLAQTSLVLWNGEVEQKHSRECECLKETKDDKIMDRIIEEIDGNNRVKCKWCGGFNTNRSGYYKNKYQVIWCFDCGKSFQTLKLKSLISDKAELMKLPEVYKILLNLRDGHKLSKKERNAVDEAIKQVDITIENG